MSRYNYFDDYPEKFESDNNSKINTGLNIDFNKAAGVIKQQTKSFIKNNPLGALKEIIVLPNLRSVFLKLIAFVLFVIAILIFIIAFSHSINSQNEKNQKFYTDAGKVCTEYITEYGTAKTESLKSDEYGKGMTALTGLCYARQMDFNSDGNDELMLCYNNRNIYTLEVWGYVDDEFTKLYSEEANKTQDKKDGSWIAFYYKNNKYYICKSTPEKPTEVALLALKGDTFKQSSSCDYDYKNNIYSVKGEINAQDFETIKLSVIKSSKAEQIIDIMTSNIESFNTVSISAINSQKTESQLKADAYYKIIDGRNERFGKAKVVKDGSNSYIDGLALVKLVDFDGDDNEELLLVYRKMVKQRSTNAYSGESIVIETPTYCMEVYSWNGAVTQKVFSVDSISNYMNNSSINYIILKNNDKSVDICSNSYSYVDEYNYTASSRIYKYKDNRFNSAFSAREENSYGYKNYYLDGKYSYRSDFNNRAFEVPKFLNDDGDYDKTKYNMIYFAGSINDDFENTVNDTVKTIGELNKSYNADD